LTTFIIHSSTPSLRNATKGPPVALCQKPFPGPQMQSIIPSFYQETLLQLSDYEYCVCGPLTRAEFKLHIIDLHTVSQFNFNHLLKDFHN
jgi:hypothetical protein